MLYLFFLPSTGNEFFLQEMKRLLDFLKVSLHHYGEPKLTKCIFWKFEKGGRERRRRVTIGWVEFCFFVNLHAAGITIVVKWPQKDVAKISVPQRNFFNLQNSLKVGNFQKTKKKLFLKICFKMKLLYLFWPKMTIDGIFSGFQKNHFLQFFMIF